MTLCIISLLRILKSQAQKNLNSCCSFYSACYKIVFIYYCKENKFLMGGLEEMFLFFIFSWQNSNFFLLDFLFLYLLFLLFYYCF
jgi:hypothetical protein